MQNMRKDTKATNNYTKYQAILTTQQYSEIPGKHKQIIH